MYSVIVVIVFLICVLVVVNHPPVTHFGPPSSPLPVKYDIYLINLDQAKKRRAHFKTQFEQTDLTHMSPIRVSAVDGKTVDLTSVVSKRAYKEIMAAEKTGFRERHYQLSRGAVGAYLSHLSCWQSLIKSDAKACIIFEDDALIYPNIGAYMSSIRVPDDWDILLLGYECLVCQKDIRLTRVHKVKKFFGLHGYMIRKEAVSKIMSSPRISPMRKQIDTVLSDMAIKGELNIYASVKKLVEQNNAEFGTQIQLPIHIENNEAWTSYDELK